jgi:hypothetical protein
MKINKLSSWLLLAFWTAMPILYLAPLVIDRKLATNIFIYDCGLFLIVGLIWFTSLFFIKKEDGSKLKTFLHMLGKLFLVFILGSVVVLFINNKYLK